jgi:hypothetical protein
VTALMRLFGWNPASIPRALANNSPGNCVSNFTAVFRGLVHGSIWIQTELPEMASRVVTRNSAPRTKADSNDCTRPGRMRCFRLQSGSDRRKDHVPTAGSCSFPGQRESFVPTAAVKSTARVAPDQTGAGRHRNLQVNPQCHRHPRNANLPLCAVGFNHSCGRRDMTLPVVLRVMKTTARTWESRRCASNGGDSMRTAGRKARHRKWETTGIKDVLSGRTNGINKLQSSC